MSPAPVLDVFQALWAMQHRQPGIPERAMEDNFRMIADAGYDGVGIDLGVTPIEEAFTFAPLLARYDLGCLITAFVKTIDGLAPVLTLARHLNARHVNLIGQVMPLGVDAAVPIARRWMEMADTAGIALQFETHRNSLTNDLFATLQLIDAVPEMVLAADLSHYVVGREFDFPPDTKTQSHIDRILQRSGSFQGRIASRQQIQVPFGLPRYAKWLGLFLAWWERGFRYWREAGAGGPLNFLCELGPYEYAMTDSNGLELSDRWLEALTLKQHVHHIWARLEADTPMS